MADEHSRSHGLVNRAERVSGVGSYAWIPATDEISWSDNGHRLLNRAQGAPLATHQEFLAAVHPDDRGAVSRAVAHAMEGKPADPVRFRLMGSGGAARHMLYRAERDEDVGVVRLIGTLQDRTSEVETQRSLVEHTQVLEQAQRVAHVGSWVWRPSTGAITWSPELYRITGVDPSRVPSVTSFDELIHPDDLSGLRATREKTLADGVPRPWEGRIVRPSTGEARWIRTEAMAIEDDPLWLLGVVHDVTEQRHLAEQLQHGRTLQAVGRLASGVAHDFNNFLTVMMGSLHLAAQTSPSPALDDALLATDAAVELTQRLLSLGGTSQLPLEAIDLDMAVKGSERLLRAALPEEVALVVEAVSGAIVKADRRQLDQLLLNLVLNARNAVGQQGRVWVRARREDDHAVLEVVDDGPGMSEEALRRATEPFFTTKGPGLGNGLGLAMVRGVVNHMGGQLRFEFPPSGGTSVSVWMPLSRTPAKAMPSSAAVAAPSPSLCVLIVEDEAAVRRVTARILEGAGVEVVTACDPEDARRHQEHPFDMVLCDVAMPNGGGRAVLEWLSEQRPSAPILFMTGYAHRAEWLEGYEVLPKPFMPQALIDAVARVAARHALGQVAPAS